MTSDQLDEYAERLAHAAIEVCGDIAEAAGVLVQAGLAVTLAHYPPRVAEQAIERLLEETRVSLALLNAEGATRQ
jgi:LmbE family N-acetylglucosaminyl deacetylase